ncbi:MAG: heme o synthase [Planctomycetota bacterium]
MRQLTDPSPSTLDPQEAYAPSLYDPVDPPSTDEFVERFVQTPSRLSDYKALTKPRITRMVVITAAVGFVFGFGFAAGKPISQLPLLVFAIAMIGTALSCMAASVFNQILERDTDALMDRTKDRPIAAGRITARPASAFGTLLAVAGIGLLVAFGLHLAAALCAFTIASYAVVYTPLKRRTSLSLLIGAVPGALPPMIGFAAAAETFVPINRALGPAAWLLFSIMFVWQVPHFLAIAWLYRDDYAKAQLAMLPVIDPTGMRTFRQTLIGCLLLLPLGILPTALGVAGRWYFAAALLCGLGFLACGVLLVLKPTRDSARKLFLASLVYLPVVLTVMLIDRV